MKKMPENCGHFQRMSCTHGALGKHNLQVVSELNRIKVFFIQRALVITIHEGT